VRDCLEGRDALHIGHNSTTYCALPAQFWDGIEGLRSLVFKRTEKGVRDCLEGRDALNIYCTTLPLIASPLPPTFEMSSRGWGFFCFLTHRKRSARLPGRAWCAASGRRQACEGSNPWGEGNHSPRKQKQRSNGIVLNTLVRRETVTHTNTRQEQHHEVCEWDDS